MAKIIKTYESFILDGKFKFELNVIDPIIETIKNNQEFLTKPENLPQLAKLGYMYNTLWYSGRVCWGYDGLLLDKGIKKRIKNDDEEAYEWVSCEDNPKDKIEDCEPINDEIDNLINDAWGLHVNDDMMFKFDDFSQIVTIGRPLTEIEKKELKINKTFEDWVEIKLDPNYKYKSLYSNVKSVADNLLCTIGSGYSFNKEGYIIEEASGADQDKAIYGDWKNAKFSGEIKSMVDRIMAMPEVKKTLDTAFDHINKLKIERKKKDGTSWMDSMRDKLKDIDLDDDFDLDALIKKLKGHKDDEKVKKVEKYRQYYPISTSSKIYAVIDKETRDRVGIKEIHQSYVDASINICKDIIEHISEESEENVKFAKKLLTKYNISDYSKEFPQEVDKYELEEDLKDILLPVTDHFNKAKQLKAGDYRFYLNDTKTNQYGDNNYYFNISLKGLGVKPGLYTNIDFLKSTNFYQDLKDSIDTISKIEDIKRIEISCDNIPGSNQELDIKFIANDEGRHDNYKDQEVFDNNLIKEGFQVGSNNVVLELKNIILVCRKPIVLGSKNKTGKEIFSSNHQVSVRDKSWRQIFAFNLDERNINTINIKKSSTLMSWIGDEFNKMKLSNPNYGVGGKEGKECLYAHDFFIWLKKNEDNFKFGLSN